MDEYIEIISPPEQPTEVTPPAETPTEIVAEPEVFIEILQPPTIYIDLLVDPVVEEIEIITGVPIYSGAGGRTSVIGETPTGAINGTNVNYVTSQVFISGTLAVYANGLRMRSGVDYTITGTKNFQMLEALLTGDSLLVDYEMT